MVNNKQTANNPQTSGSAAPGVARGPEGRPPGDDDGDNPPDRIGGELAAKTQEGQPGLPKTDEKEWSPGSDQEE
jgi:hypothetical protein